MCDYIPIILSEKESISFKPKENCGCIYVYSLNNKYYVGQTSTPLYIRHMGHTHSKKQLIDNVLKRVPYILKVIWVGKIEYIDLAEIYFIKKYNSIVPTGYNLTTGGSENHFHLDITKQKISATTKGRSVPRDVIEKHYYSVSRYSLDGVFIDSFESILSASKATGTSKSHIGECARGKRKSAGGYIWCFNSDKPLNRKPHDNSQRMYTSAGYERITKKIAKCDMEGEIIETYDSIKQASVSNSINSSHISSCAKGDRKTAGGFKWKYV